MKFDANKLSIAGAIVAAGCMLLLSLLASGGMYVEAAEQMMRWHMFYDLGVGGTIAGMIEAAVITYIGLYVFAALYNKMIEKKA